MVIFLRALCQKFLRGSVLFSHTRMFRKTFHFLVAQNCPRGEQEYTCDARDRDDRVRWQYDAENK